MAIEVRLFASLRDAVGQSTVSVETSDGQTVRDVLRMLEADHAALEGQLLDNREIADSIVVLVNGRPVNHLNGDGTTVGDSDRISITLPISGGSPGRVASH